RRVGEADHPKLAGAIVHHGDAVQLERVVAFGVQREDRRIVQLKWERANESLDLTERVHRQRILVDERRVGGPYDVRLMDGVVAVIELFVDVPLRIRQVLAYRPQVGSPHEQAVIVVAGRVVAVVTRTKTGPSRSASTRSSTLATTDSCGVVSPVAACDRVRSVCVKSPSWPVTRFPLPGSVMEYGAT